MLDSLMGGVFKDMPIFYIPDQNMAVNKFDFEEENSQVSSGYTFFQFPPQSLNTFLELFWPRNNALCTWRRKVRAFTGF